MTRFPLKKSAVLSAVFIAATITAVPVALMQSAQAQGAGVTTVQYNPPRYGAWGDRDRDGVPNWADPYNNNRDRYQYRDRDHDGIPNRYDRDRDGDGVPNRYDRRPDNPYRY